jgi:NAD(P) transhydrogenase subunit alpha
MVEDMKTGSVIVDLASEGGGNCELTKPGETFEYKGRVTIHGPLNVAGELPIHASEMYAKNLFNLISPFITEDGNLALDFEDDVIAGCVLTREGAIVHEHYKN